MKIRLSAILLVFVSTMVQADDFHFRIGARLQFSNWVGTGADSYRRSGGRLGTNISVQDGKFFGGVNLIRGEFEFTGQAPQRPTGPQATAPTTISRNDVDLIAGYQLHPRFATTLALKSVVNEWAVDGYRIEASGIGLGFSANHPLREPLFFYGNLSVFFGPAHINDVKSGSAGGASLEMGLSYQIKNTSLSASLLTQSLRHDFDNGSELSFDVGGVTFGVQHRF